MKIRMDINDKSSSYQPVEQLMDEPTNAMYHSGLIQKDALYISDASSNDSSESPGSWSSPDGSVHEHVEKNLHMCREASETETVSNEERTASDEEGTASSESWTTSDAERTDYSDEELSNIGYSSCDMSGSHSSPSECSSALSESSAHSHDERNNQDSKLLEIPPSERENLIHEDDLSITGNGHLSDDFLMTETGTLFDVDSYWDSMKSKDMSNMEISGNVACDEQTNSEHVVVSTTELLGSNKSWLHGDLNASYSNTNSGIQRNSFEKQMTESQSGHVMSSYGGFDDGKFNDNIHTNMLHLHQSCDKLPHIQKNNYSGSYSTVDVFSDTKHTSRRRESAQSKRQGAEISHNSCDLEQTQSADLFAKAIPNTNQSVSRTRSLLGSGQQYSVHASQDLGSHTPQRDQPSTAHHSVKSSTPTASGHPLVSLPATLISPIPSSTASCHMTSEPLKVSKTVHSQIDLTPGVQVDCSVTGLPPGEGLNHPKSELPPSEKADNEELKRRKKRTRIIEELLHTEDTYQKHLQLGVQNFEIPLRDNGILPADVIVAIFSNMQQLIKINQELVKHLADLSVGEAFLKLGPFLKLYSTYAKNHERALAVLMEWDQKSPEFSAFRRKQEEREEMNGLKLNALLITPVQRVPRYRLLLEDLLVNTTHDHKDYYAIKEAVSKVAAVANHINDHIKQQDNFMKMLAIQKSLTGPAVPKLLIPGRMLVKEGTLKKVSKKGGGSRERKFFLFSDIFMYAKPRLLESGASHSYVCCCILPLQHCQVTRVFGHSQGQGALFTVKCKAESLLLFSDQKVVNSWISALEKTIGMFVDSQQTLRKVSSAKQPLRKAAIARLLRHEKQVDLLSTSARHTPEARKRVLKEPDTNTPTKVKVKATSQTNSSEDTHSFMKSLGCLSPHRFSKRWRNSQRDVMDSVVTDTVTMDTSTQIAEDNTSQSENETKRSRHVRKMDLDAKMLSASTLRGNSQCDMSLQGSQRDISLQCRHVWRLDDTTLSTSINWNQLQSTACNSHTDSNQCRSSTACNSHTDSNQCRSSTACNSHTDTNQCSGSTACNSHIDSNQPSSSITCKCQYNSSTVCNFLLGDEMHSIEPIFHRNQSQADKNCLTTSMSKRPNSNSGLAINQCSQSEALNRSAAGNNVSFANAFDAATKLAKNVYPSSQHVNYGAACNLQ